MRPGLLPLSTNLGVFNRELDLKMGLLGIKNSLSLGVTTAHLFLHILGGREVGV